MTNSARSVDELTFTAGWARGYRAGYAEAVRSVRRDLDQKNRSPQVPFLDAGQDYIEHLQPVKLLNCTGYHNADTAFSR